MLGKFWNVYSHALCYHCATVEFMVSAGIHCEYWRFLQAQAASLDLILHCCKKKEQGNYWFSWEDLQLYVLRTVLNFS